MGEHRCIKCNVANCEFHSSKDLCKAEEIEVGPHYANSSSDTVCSTFKPGKNC